MKPLLTIIKEQDTLFDKKFVFNAGWRDADGKAKSALRLRGNISPKAIKAFYQKSLITLLEANCERLRGSKRELPKTKCINAENHLFGSCFSCEKLKGYNEAIDEEIALYEALITALKEEK